MNLNRMEKEGDSYSALCRWAKTHMWPSSHWCTWPALIWDTDSHGLAFTAHHGMRPAHGHGGWRASEALSACSWRATRVHDRDLVWLVVSGGWLVNDEVYTRVFLIPHRTHMATRSGPMRIKRRKRSKGAAQR
jgi:hypothetical protein